MKRVCLILVLILFFVLGASCVHAQDNSTDFVFQNQSGDFISDDGNDFESYFNNFSRPCFDENYTFANLSDDISEGNLTDLRNSHDDNQTQDILPISSPAGMNTMWAEFVNDPEAFMEKYNSQPDASSISWDDYVQANDSCGRPYSKEFADFMNFVEMTKVTPASIESADAKVFYSKGNVFRVRVLNALGDSVAEGVNVTFVLNGKKINAKTDKNGYVGFRFNCQAGTYQVKTLAGNVTSKNKITVKALFKTSDVTKRHAKSSKFTVKLIKRNAKSLSRQTVKITFKGKCYKIKTNSKGVATFAIPKNLKTGKYSIKTSYKGCVVKNKITVKR